MAIAEAPRMAEAIGLGRSRRFLPELESLRGIAVLVVFMGHAEGLVRPKLAEAISPLGAFVRNGRTGVDIFFVLSGFLLSLPFIQDLRAGRRPGLAEYLARRALRILPLYYVAVALGTILTSTQLADLLRGLPFLVMLNSFSWFFTPMAPYGTVWWSLATEVQFYLALPLVVILCRTRPGRWAAGLLLGAYAVAYTAYVAGGPWMGTFTGEMLLQASLFGRAPMFLGGMLAAVVYDRWGAGVRDCLARSAWMRNGAADVLLLLLLAALGCFLRWIVGLGPRGAMPRYQARDVIEALGWSTAMLFLLLAPLRTKALLSNALMARIGVISYSVYLVHVPLLVYGMRALRRAGLVTGAGWNPAMLAGVTLVGGVCIGASELTFRCVERPFLRRKARFDSRAGAGGRRGAERSAPRIASGMPEHTAGTLEKIGPSKATTPVG
jgi:peptidoglycan/LPS O-acetylase OafA/YrhL